MYVLLCPLISASSLTPPRDMRTNFLPRAEAIEDANDVFPTPGGPTKHNIGPLASGLSCNAHTLNIRYTLRCRLPRIYWEAQ